MTLIPSICFSGKAALAALSTTLSDPPTPSQTAPSFPSQPLQPFPSPSSSSHPRCFLPSSPSYAWDASPPPACAPTVPFPFKPILAAT